MNSPIDRVTQIPGRRRLDWLGALALIVAGLLSPCPATAQPFQRVGYDLPSLYQPTMAWGDIDHDGDQDLAICGDIQVSSGTTYKNIPISRLYRNDGDTFTELPHWIKDVDQGALAWADYDGDGDLDLALAGADGVTSTSCLTRIYRNDNQRFVDSGITLPGVRSAKLKWGDYDHDRYPDLALAGITANGQTIARIYHNNHGKLVDIQATLSGGSPDWGDFDGDGDLDLALAGSLTPGDTSQSAKIYRNDGGTFADLHATLPEKILQAAWVDLDHDGKCELSLIQYLTNTSNAVRILRISGGTFQDTGFNPIAYFHTTLAWGDVNQDGYPDLYLAGFIVDLPPYPTSELYMNDHGVLAAKAVSAPLISTIISWTDYDGDGRLDMAALNKSVYDYPGPALNPGLHLAHNEGTTFTDAVKSWFFGSEFELTLRSSWQDLDNSGFPALLMLGVNSYGYNHGTLYRNHEGQLTPVDGPVYGSSALCWNDLDRDGDPDLVISGSENLRPLMHFIYANLSLYRNDHGALTHLTTNLPELGCYSVAPADFNGDGRTDLALSGYRKIDSYNSEIITDIYRQDNLTSYTALKANLPRFPCNLAAADYDKDGWPDLALVNSSFTTSPLSAIYHNQHGTLVPSAITLMTLKFGQPRWVDFDADGDPDLVLTGTKTDNTPAIKIYRNDGGGKFTDLGAPLPALDAAGMDWGDYDGDGDLDVALYGTDFAKVFRNDGGAFAEADLGLQDTGPMAWGDYDHDGDLDLIVGQRLYRNYRITPAVTLNAVKDWRLWDR